MNKAWKVKLKGVKRSILYDFHKKMEELKTFLKAANDPVVDEAVQQKAILTPLPTRQFKEFVNFEKQL